MRREWLTSRLCRGPYWAWWLLYTISPYHRGYDAGYRQAVKNMRHAPAVSAVPLASGTDEGAA